MQNKTYSTFICVLTNKVGTKEYNDLFKDISNEIGKVSRIIPNSVWKAPIQYVAEMGDNLQNEIWFLDKMNLSQVVVLKRWLIYFEYEYSVNGHRQFNLNPGYISSDGMFLLTHKDNQLRGRQFLENGIWQEKQYIIEKSIFRPFENTFDEFLGADRLNLFNRLNETENLTAHNKGFAKVGHLC